MLVLQWWDYDTGGYRVQTTGYRLQATGYRLQIHYFYGSPSCTTTTYTHRATCTSPYPYRGLFS